MTPASIRDLLAQGRLSGSSRTPWRRERCSRRPRDTLTRPEDLKVGCERRLLAAVRRGSQGRGRSHAREGIPGSRPPQAPPPWISSASAWHALQSSTTRSAHSTSCSLARAAWERSRTAPSSTRSSQTETRSWLASSGSRRSSWRTISARAATEEVVERGGELRRDQAIGDRALLRAPAGPLLPLSGTAQPADRKAHKAAWSITTARGSTARRHGAGIPANVSRHCNDSPASACFCVSTFRHCPALGPRVILADTLLTDKLLKSLGVATMEPWNSSEGSASSRSSRSD